MLTKCFRSTIAPTLHTSHTILFCSKRTFSIVSSFSTKSSSNPVSWFLDMSKSCADRIKGDEYVRIEQIVWLSWNKGVNFGTVVWLIFSNCQQNGKFWGVGKVLNVELIAVKWHIYVNLLNLHKEQIYSPRPLKILKYSPVTSQLPFNSIIPDYFAISSLINYRYWHVVCHVCTKTFRIVEYLQNRWKKFDNGRKLKIFKWGHTYQAYVFLRTEW